MSSVNFVVNVVILMDLDQGIGKAYCLVDSSLTDERNQSVYTASMAKESCEVWFAGKGSVICN